jgi:hypothetical protein
MTPDRTGPSRRRVLTALGAVGVAAAGAGLGTTGYLHDVERYPATLAAGGLDLAVGYASTYNGELVDAAPADPDGVVAGDCGTPGLVDGAGVPVVDLDDVKPGDCGTVSASLYVCANPARLWLAVDLVGAAEHDHRPEERLAGDRTPDVGELQDLIAVTCWIDVDGDGTVGADERVVYEGSLAGLATAAAEGLLLTADSGGTPTCAEGGAVLPVGLAWCLPLDGPDHNRAITDAVAFDLRFGAVQCRHDPTGRSPFAATDGSTAVRDADTGG